MFCATTFQALSLPADGALKYRFHSTAASPVVSVIAT